MGSSRWAEGYPSLECTLDIAICHISATYTQDNWEEAPLSRLRYYLYHIKLPRHHLCNSWSYQQHWTSAELWVLPCIPFSVNTQPCVLVFVDKKELACCIAAHLDTCLPAEYQKRGIVWHYHSMMSQKYLQVTHEAFTTLTGNCHILVATSGQSVVSTNKLSIYLNQS